MMRLVFIFTLMTFISCHRSKQIGETSVPQDEVQAELPKVITEMGYSKETDTYRIYSLEAEGTVLSIGVEYGGGCKDHTFQLYTDGIILKSLPPKQRFFLQHHADNDLCKALVRDTISFQLEGIRPAGTQLVVLLEGYEQDLTVKF